MAIKLLIDSASDINRQEAEKLGVIMLPMIVTFGEEEFLDGVDLLPSRFYQKLTESDAMPKTSQISPYRFEKAFEEYTADGDEIIAIVISSKLSGTYAAAKQAAEKFAGKVYVIDSMNACVGERLLGQYALQLIGRGFTAAEIAAELERKKSKVRLIAMLNTLEFLKKGGRISAAAAFAGSLLSLKSLVSITDGKVKLIGKAMGVKMGTRLLTKRISEQKGIDFDMPYGVVWSGIDNSLLNKYVKDNADLWQGHAEHVPAYMLGCTMGTHIGPGGIGVAFFEKE